MKRVVSWPVVVRFFILFALLCSLGWASERSPHPSLYSNCKDALLAETNDWKKHPLLSSIKTLLKLPFYPIYIQGKIGLGGMYYTSKDHLRKETKKSVIARVLRGEFTPVSLYIVLSALGIDPAQVFSIDVIGVKHTALVPPDFYTSSDVLTVGTVGTDKWDPLFKPLQYITGSGVKDNRNVFHTEHTDFRKAIEHLIEIRKKTGRPIQRWVFASHGFPGRLFMDRFDRDDDLTDEWIQKNATFLNEEVPEDLFEEGAEITLVACEPAINFHVPGVSTLEGKAFIQNLFSKLLKKGGKVSVSTRIVFIDYDQIPKTFHPSGLDEPQGIMAQLQKHYVNAGVALYSSARWIASDNEGRFHKTLVVEIPKRP